MTPEAAVSAVRYRDRVSGELVTETIFSERELRWFYEDPVGSRVFATLLNRRAFCWLYGKLQDLPSSRRKIPAFVATHGIDVAEAEQPEYPSFNAFFSRRLRPGARPFCPDPDDFPSPGEGKVLVFPRLHNGDRLPVKGARLTLEALLGSADEAAPFIGGTALVLRLAPYDYHRFHFPDDGIPVATREIPGRYHSVSPIALTRVPDLYARNKRQVTVFESRHFGRIGYVEVGAICVGTIIQTFSPGQAVSRGDEKGHFRFGGSTLVLLFQPGVIEFDDDLVRDSAEGLEVQVRAGSRIGQRRRHVSS
jgi:phosphatidylserine decarboxylase